MYIVTDTLKYSMVNLRLSILASRVVCGGITIIYMVSVVAYHGHTVHTYGSDEIFSVQKTLHFTAHIL